MRADGVSWGETVGSIGDHMVLSLGWHNAKHQAEFGRPADVLTGPAVACVLVLANAIERAGTLDRAAIREAMAIDMMTVIGPVSFREDGTGVVLNPFIQWQAGKQELVWPSEHATAPFAFPALPFEER
jgi:branched-chain amino acid transport system substrate-binding protein